MQFGQPARRRRASPEQDLHLAAADFLRAALRAPEVWTTFPAGGGGHGRGGQLKAMGLKRGWPDLLVMRPIGGGSPPPGFATLVLGIELKAERGRLSPEQKAVHAELAACHCPVEVCRSLEEIADALAGHGFTLHARLLAGGGYMKVAA